jgi:phosphoribosylformylglycinamidine cyclo-ligase
MTDEELTYASSGVSYDTLDAFKRMAQNAAGHTAPNIERLGLSEVVASRGESAYLIEFPDFFLAHVEEGLGTKNLVVEELSVPNARTELSIHPRYWESIAQDTVAMIVNDMVTLGALPVSVAMHLAVGDSDWFGDPARVEYLIKGWAKACDLAKCTWGGGETPTLKGIVQPGTAVLSGSATGIIRPKETLIRGDIQDGDAIVMLESSGVHANGLTLARQIASKVGYLERTSDGRFFAEGLLEPTLIYVPVIEHLLGLGIDIHYAVNITGHGWRKLMRAVEPFVYTVWEIPTPQPVFDFIQKHGHVGDEEMYGNYNMGAGFALYVDFASYQQVTDVSKQFGIEAWLAGKVEKRDDEKAVVIEPKGLRYEGSTLEVR